MKVFTFFYKVVFTGTIMLTQTAFAECTSVGMMGGCIPAAGMVDVPAHMKSQIPNRVVSQKPNSTAKAKSTSAINKALSAKVAVANATQTVQK